MTGSNNYLEADFDYVDNLDYNQTFNVVSL